MIRILRVNTVDQDGNVTGRNTITFDDETLWARLVAAGNLIDAESERPSILEANWNADSPPPPPPPTE